MLQALMSEFADTNGDIARRKSCLAGRSANKTPGTGNGRLRSDDDARTKSDDDARTKSDDDARTRSDDGARTRSGWTTIKAGSLHSTDTDDANAKADALSRSLHHYVHSLPASTSDLQPKFQSSREPYPASMLRYTAGTPGYSPKVSATRTLASHSWPQRHNYRCYRHL